MLKQRFIHVGWRGENHKVWVVDGFDQFLDDFAEEVGGSLNDERCPFGVLLWPSSRTLADYLAEHTPSQPFRTIVELGCGVGFLSCVLAKLYPKATIIACDYEANLESFVQKNAREWGVDDRVHFRPVDWRQSVPDDIRLQCDAVFGADVFYDDSHIRHLPPFASELLRPGGLLMLADPKRYRFGKAMEELQERFALQSIRDEPCALDREGIEEFMVGTGLKDQKISILELRKSGGR